MPITNEQLRQYQAMYARRDPELPPEKLAAYDKEYSRMYLHTPALPMLWRQKPIRPITWQVVTNCLFPRLERRMATLFNVISNRYALPEIMQHRVFFADMFLDTITGVDWQTTQFVMDRTIPPWAVLRFARVNRAQQESGEIGLQSAQLSITVMQMAAILAQDRLTANDVIVVRRPALGRPAWTFYAYRFELVARAVGPMIKADKSFAQSTAAVRNKLIGSVSWYLCTLREKQALAFRGVDKLLPPSSRKLIMYSRLLAVAAHLKANAVPAVFARMHAKGRYHAIQPDTVHREEPFPQL